MYNQMCYEDKQMFIIYKVISLLNIQKIEACNKNKRAVVFYTIFKFPLSVKQS